MQVSKLQVVDSKYWGGLTTDTHLGNLHMLEPQLISNVMTQLYKVETGGDDFISFIDQFPKYKVNDDSTPYQWLLVGSDERNIPLVGASMTLAEAQAGTYLTAASNEEPGLALGRFYMTFNERYFVQTSVIVGENPNDYSLRVVSNPIHAGNKYIYEVELITGDLELFVPVEDLVANTRWSEDYGQVTQTLSERGTEVKHSSAMRMENTLSMIRKNYEVPGNMIRKGANAPLVAKFVGDNGKPIVRWIDKLGWDFWKQMRRDQARLLMYGKSNKLASGEFGNKDDNGYEIRSGFGLYEQVAPSNIFKYNKFSLDYLGEVAMGLTFGKVPEDSRELLLSTGQYGMYQFHKAAEDKASGITYLSDNKQLVDLGSGKLGIRGQFVEYAFVNGIKFKLMIDPMLDDRVRNKKRHPEGGLYSSYEYNIWDFGTTNSEPNIQRVYLEGDEEIFKYTPGLRDPFSPYNNLTSPGIAASGKDGYEVFKAFIGGIMVRNPLRTARLLPSIL